MIFKFGRKGGNQPAAEEVEVELIRFQGATNGVSFDMQAHEKLVRIAFEPIKELLTDAVNRRAETLRVDPKGDRATIAFLVDGVPVPAGRIPRQRAHAMTQMAKLLGGLDVSVRTEPQAGGVKASLEADEFEIEILTQPVAGGVERLTAHIRNLDEELDKPEDIGMTVDLKTKIREVTGHDQGVFLACGPPRSGVTTTLFASIRGLDAYLRDIQTICDTGGRELVNISRFETNAEDDLQESIRRCVRIEPNVILLDPIADASTAQMVAEFSDRVSFVSEITAKDAANGVLQWLEWIGDPAKGVESLSGTVSQKLIRRLCNDCKEAYKPNPNLLRKIGLDPEEVSVLYRKARPPADAIEKGEEMEPCYTCNDSGYRGRVALFEIIEMNDEMKQLVGSGANAAAIQTKARESDMLTLQQDAMRHVADGTTSLEELQRVFKAG